MSFPCSGSASVTSCSPRRSAGSSRRILEVARSGTIRVTQRPAPANDATATTSKNEGVAHAPDPILDGLDATFLVNATHVDTVAELPPGATILASTSLEPTAVFRVGRAWGVQFHPEIDRAAMRAYLTVRRPVLEPEGLDVDALLDAADECTAGARILQNFCAHVRTTR